MALTPRGATPAPSGATSAPTATPKATATPTAFATATPTAVATATPTPAGSSGAATTVSVNGGAALAMQPLNTMAPAPAGYTQSISLPNVVAAANTTVRVTAGTSVPAGLAPLARPRAALFHRFAASGAYDTIFYDSIVPSADITVSGTLSFTQSYPSGGLVAGQSYYLGYYDTTQASPAWQTIAGPVSPSGTDLTFTGTISSLTLGAGKLYGFAVFSQNTPTATPPPAPQTLLYFGNNTALTVAKEDGTVVNTLNIPSNSFDLDDAGNVYAFANSTAGVIKKYPAGSATPAASYTLSGSGSLAFVAVSGSGEVAAVHLLNEGDTTVTTDVWDAGSTGAPSRTIVTQQSQNFAFVMTHDGTLYLPDHSAAGVPQFDVIPPGTSTPSSTIPETIVPATQYGNFAPNYAAVGADGTLYLTEYTFTQPDPNAGLYIYPLHGAERFVATPGDANGAGPNGVDVDASNNIYVLNNNSGYLPASNTCQADTLGELSVYAQDGTPLRTISGLTSGFPITVAADGTAFLSTFAAKFASSCAPTGADAIFSVASGARTATQIATSGSTQIVLFDGTHKTIPDARRGHGVSVSVGRGGRGGFLRKYNSTI